MVVDTPRTDTSQPPPRRPQLGWARAVAIVSLVVALTILCHGFLPGSFGTLVATALPWIGWLPPLLLAASLFTRARRLWIVVTVPTLVWILMIGSTFLPLSTGGSDGGAEQSLTVATHNVRGASNAAAASAQVLANEGADVIALVELDAENREAATQELAASHPYSYMVGTVGLWSVYPIDQEMPLDLGLGWRRALSVDVATPSGPVSVYVIHAASFRPGDQDERDTMLQNLGNLIPQDLNERVIVMGDFNATTFDPAMRRILDTVNEPRQSTPSWGFSWPSALPVARIDHVLQRGLIPLSNRVLVAGESDHRALLTVFAID